jgi:hypothetical protein
MNRRTVLITSGSLGLLLGVTILAILTCNSGSKVTVRFVNAESSNGEFPAYAPSERLDFAVRNVGSKSASVEVSGIQDEHGTWVPARRGLGDVDAGKQTQFYLYLPLGSSRPSSVRMRVLEKASGIQKTRCAIRLLIEKASGRYPGKQVWFDGLKVPAYELIVKLDKDA